MPVNSGNLNFRLICDVIGCTEFNEIESHDRPLAWLSNDVSIAYIGPGVSDIIGGRNTPTAGSAHQ